MDILLAGYGFYVLGNKKLEGGTILPSLLNWSSLSQVNIINLTCVVRNDESLLKAKKRFNDFFKKYPFFSNFKFHIKKYDEVNQNFKFDCGIIAIPEKSHLNCIEFMSNLTKDIICVKPLTENKKQYNKAIKIAKEQNLNIFIDFHKRFDESNIEFIYQASLNSNKNGFFTFSYGQKEEMPLEYFSKWSKSSNPFQYLAPHYLDIIFLILKNKGVNCKNLKIEGYANVLRFRNDPEIISMIACNLKLFDDENYYLLNSMCNWMEPVMSPFSSRQRIEFQTESTHLISEQDNRGQMIIKDEIIKIPNPHFMTRDLNFCSSGYGIKSFSNFLDYVSNRFPKNRLATIDDYEPIINVIDYVNNLIK